MNRWHFGRTLTVVFSFLFLFGIHPAFALPPAPRLPPVNPWTNINWSWEWGTLDNLPFSFVITLLPILVAWLSVFVVSQIRRRQQGNDYKMAAEVDRMLHPSRKKLWLFFLFFATSSWLAGAIVAFQKQWFWVSDRLVVFYIPNLILWIATWYLFACLAAEVKRLYLFLIVGLAVLILGYSICISYINGKAQASVYKSVNTPIQIGWWRAIKFINQCNAQLLAQDPYVILKDGQVVNLTDPPGYETMVKATQNVRSRCGYISVVPN
jgi:hypothetical protein